MTLKCSSSLASSPLLGKVIKEGHIQDKSVHADVAGLNLQDLSWRIRPVRVSKGPARFGHLTITEFEYTTCSVPLVQANFNNIRGANRFSLEAVLHTALSTALICQTGTQHISVTAVGIQSTPPVGRDGG
eukprot:2219754-Amphidinium_carterae.1